MKKQSNNLPSLVEIQRNDVFTTSKIIAEGTHNPHHTVTKHIRKYRERFESFGELRFMDLKSINKLDGRGRPERIYYLNEAQATFLITFLRNTDTVLDFKQALVKEFFRMRKILNNLIINRSNKQWQELRLESKTVRVQETDIIKEFIEYAIRQGSKNAKMYYVNITKLENNTLFVIDEALKQSKKNIRELLNIEQLRNIMFVEQIVKKAIKDGMQEGFHYKDIYKLIKERLEILADNGLLGKSVVPSINQKLLK